MDGAFHGTNRSNGYGRHASVPDVVVWEADGRREVGGYGRTIAARLVHSGFSVTTVSLVDRTPDERELASPMHVLSGGDTAVDAEVEWLVAARERLVWLLQEALAGRRVVTGICFGAQLIAHLLAGPDATGPHPDGLQAGLMALRREDVGPVSSFHYHSIRRGAIEAAGATIDVDSECTEVQAYRFGRRVRGVQFHPELAPVELHRTLHAYEDVLARHGMSFTAVESNLASHRWRWTHRPWHEYVVAPTELALHAAA